MAMPPLPPGTAAQTPATPNPGMNFASMAGMNQGGGDPSMMGQQQAMSPGLSQISESVVRMGAEIDQALKLLAQSIPTLAPWVEKTCLELRYQLGSAINTSAVPTNPSPQDGERFPDGGGRL